MGPMEITNTDSSLLLKSSCSLGYAGQLLSTVRTELCLWRSTIIDWY